MYLVTGDAWCPLPDLHLPDHVSSFNFNNMHSGKQGSGLLAVNLGKKIVVCGFPAPTSQPPNLLASSPVLGQETRDYSMAEVEL